MNDKIWNFFYRNYNGGPEIILSKYDDIYTSFFSASQKDHFDYVILKDSTLMNNSAQLDNTISIYLLINIS